MMSENCAVPRADKTLADEVLDFILTNPRSFFEERTGSTYDRLLGLYEEVGFAPAPDQRSQWRRNTLEAWALIDEALPGSTTIGLDNDRAIASFGALPIAPDITYSHSGCMIKTLSAAISLFAQAIHHVGRWSSLYRSSYFGGGYACRSRFTSQFQQDCAQVRIETLLCRHVGDSREVKITPDLYVSEVERAYSDDLTPEQTWALSALSHVSSALRSLRSTSLACVRSCRDDRVRAFLIHQSGTQCITAEDIHEETLVFPLCDEYGIGELCTKLRYLESIGDRHLYFFLKSPPAGNLRIQGELTSPSFWVATRIIDAGLLIQSYKRAFRTVLIKYRESDLRRVLEW